MNENLEGDKLKILYISIKTETFLIKYITLTIFIHAYKDTVSFIEVVEILLKFSGVVSQI